MVKIDKIEERLFLGMLLLVAVILFRIFLAPMIALAALCIILYVSGTIIDKIYTWWYRKK